jgi:hypothetical protein
LRAITAAYEEAKSSLDPRHTKDLDIIVERVFKLSNGSYAEFRTSCASKLPKPSITPSLGTYINEGCLICSIHHVGYFSSWNLLCIVLTLVQCHVHGKFEEESINEEQGSGTSEQIKNNSRSSGRKITSIKYKQYNIPDTHMQTRNGAIHTPYRGDKDKDNTEGGTHCSSACFKAGPNEDQKLDQLRTREEDEILRAYLMQMQAEPDAACLLAPMLHTSCVEVHCNIERMNKLFMHGQERSLEDYEQAKTMNAKDREKYTSKYSLCPLLFSHVLIIPQ